MTKKLFLLLLVMLPIFVNAQTPLKSLFEEPDTKYLQMKQKSHLKTLDSKFKSALKKGKQEDGCYHVEHLCKSGYKIYMEKGVNFEGIPYTEAVEYAEHYNYQILDFEQETWEGYYRPRGNQPIFVRNLRFLPKDEVEALLASNRAKQEAQKQQEQQEASAKKEKLSNVISSTSAFRAYSINDWSEGYVGEKDAKGLPQGKGVLCWVYKDGSKARYEGYFDKGLPGDGQHQGTVCIWKNGVLNFIGSSKYTSKKDKNDGYRLFSNGETEYFEAPNYYYYGTSTQGQLNGVKVDIFDRRKCEMVSGNANAASWTSPGSLDDITQNALKKNISMFTDVWDNYAESGQMMFAYNLAQMYLSGNVVEKDSAKAAHLIAMVVENDKTRTARYGKLKELLCGDEFYKRTDFANKYIDATYAADFMWWNHISGDGIRRAAFGLNGYLSGPFEKSYRKGHPKAVKKIKEWAEAGYSRPKSLMAEYDSLGGVVKSQFKEMETTVNSSKFYVPVMDKTVFNFIDFYGQNDPKGYMDYARYALAFIFVSYVYNQDFETRDYGVRHQGIVSIYYGSGRKEIDSLRYAIYLCESEKDPILRPYFQKCLPVLKKKLDRMPSLLEEKQERLDELSAEFARQWKEFIRRTPSSSSYSSRSSSSSRDSSSNDDDEDRDDDDRSTSSSDSGSIDPENVKIPEGVIYDTEEIKNITGENDVRKLVKFRESGENYYTSYTYIVDSDEYKCRQGLFYKNEDDAKAAAFVWERYGLVRKKGSK